VRAVQIEEFGGPEVLQVAELPKPEPGEGEVLVEVARAGLNFGDTHQRENSYLAKFELPLVLGGEVAGTTPDGQRVVALLRSGGYAEWAAAPEATTFPLPDGLDDEAALALLVQGLTAWHLYKTSAKLAEGESVVVISGAGGVGSLAVQLAKPFGAGRVIATASSEEKRAFAVEQGADDAYSYEEFGEAVRADVVIDPVGGDLVARSLKVLQPLGSHVLIGYAGGLWKEMSPALLVGRNVSLHGFYLGRLMRHRPELVQEATRELMTLWESGAVRPVVGASFPLEQAADAHRLIEERKSVGKVVLVP
jgi:NADPH:quinone reductase